MNKDSGCVCGRAGREGAPGYCQRAGVYRCDSVSRMPV